MTGMNILQKHTKNGINLKTNDMKTKLIIQRFTDERGTIHMSNPPPPSPPKSPQGEAAPV